MSLLSRFFGQSSVSDAQKAMIDGLCFSLCSDGSAVETEIVEAVGFVAGLTGVEEAKASQLLQASLKRIGKDPDAVLASLYTNTQNDDEREAVLCAALFIQYMDGEITSGEDEVIHVLSRALKINDERVQELILQVEEQIDALSP